MCVLRSFCNWKTRKCAHFAAIEKQENQIHLYTRGFCTIHMKYLETRTTKATPPRYGLDLRSYLTKVQDGQVFTFPSGKLRKYAIKVQHITMRGLERLRSYDLPRSRIKQQMWKVSEGNEIYPRRGGIQVLCMGQANMGFVWGYECKYRKPNGGGNFTNMKNQTSIHHHHTKKGKEKVMILKWLIVGFKIQLCKPNKKLMEK